MFLLGTEAVILRLVVGLHILYGDDLHNVVIVFEIKQLVVHHEYFEFIFIIPKSSCSPSPRLSMFSSHTLNSDETNVI